MQITDFDINNLPLFLVVGVLISVILIIYNRQTKNLTINKDNYLFFISQYIGSCTVFAIILYVLYLQDSSGLDTLGIKDLLLSMNFILWGVGVYIILKGSFHFEKKGISPDIIIKRTIIATAFAEFILIFCIISTTLDIFSKQDAGIYITPILAFVVVGILYHYKDEPFKERITTIIENQKKLS